ncbi:DUF6879 family protein [Actinomadura rupiterrae]|uniref:DUF6879 family protein n=1 Tax=Actinomadura rupiterrae TaxID=559627 RepID=UPI0020A298DD|nr:DUF6879 family protein [Actinomadura rupiterrae]MCP2343562.1 hypothetical protein [Actinomadura rupiterrae]
MALLSPDEWTALLTGCERSVAHLEMRDVYAVDDEDDMFARWKRDTPPNSAELREWWQDWIDLLAPLSSTGRGVRRARIVSEPVTDYIAYEWEITSGNILAGEDVRWLPRRRASDLCLPGNDFWLIDDTTVVWNHFSGKGQWSANEVSRDASAVALCVRAFDAVWERAVPHKDYSPLR